MSKKTSVNIYSGRYYFLMGLMKCIPLQICVTVLPLLLFVTACWGTDDAIDQPPEDIEAQMLAIADEKVEIVDAVHPSLAQLQAKMNMTIYILDRHGYLAPVTFASDEKNAAKLAQTSLDMLVKEGEYHDRLPDGFSAMLPKGTSCNVSLYPERKTAIVEVSKLFATYKKEDERKVLESIVWTLTSFPNIENVQLWMDSKPLTEMPVAHTPLAQVVTRQIGINIEKSNVVNYFHSMPVTLYFSSYTEGGTAYYVPVTRLIEPAQEPIRATLEQMIAGPLDQQAMNTVMTKETKINQIVQAGNTIIVGLTDSMFEQGDPIPAELLKAVVLSLTEYKGVKQVQIKINGATNIQGTDKKNYSEPAKRPIINMVGKR